MVAHFSLKVSEVQYQNVLYFVHGFRIPTIYLLRPVVPSKKLSRKNANISSPLTAVVPFTAFSFLRFGTPGHYFSDMTVIQLCY